MCPTLLRLCAVTAQTQQTLAKIDRLLAQAGTSKSNIVEARIWIKDIGKDFKVRSETRDSLFPLQYHWEQTNRFPLSSALSELVRA